MKWKSLIFVNFSGRLACQQAMMNSDDKRLLEASASGQTDQVLQLIEEHGHQLHKFKDQVSRRLGNFRTHTPNFALKSFWQELKNIHHFPINADYSIMRKWFYPSPSLLATQQSRLLSFTALSVLNYYWDHWCIVYFYRMAEQLCI